MKQLCALLLTGFAFTNIAFTQSPEQVKLEWKIRDDETIVYKTLMNEIAPGTVEYNWEAVFATPGDSISSEARKMFDRIQESFKNIDLVTTLTSDKDAVRIEMKTVDQEKANPDSYRKKKSDDIDEIEVQKLIATLNDGVVLRGSVYKSGGIESFWVKNNQKNLIALFFELPKGAINIGDTWEIDVNFIANDQNFDCDSSYRKNEVKLLNVKVENGDTIAVLKYDIEEFVTGNFKSPFADGSAATTMLMTHEAIAEFSITNGRWKAYDGIMSLTSSGVMASNFKKSFSLATIE